MTTVKVDLEKWRASLVKHLAALPSDDACEILLKAGACRINEHHLARTIANLDFSTVLSAYVEAKCELARRKALANREDEDAPSPEDVKVMLSIGGKECGEVSMHGMRANLDDTAEGISFVIRKADGEEVFAQTASWEKIDARRKARGW